MTPGDADAGEPGTRVRSRVTFHGHVQGVFFRATACELARGFAVVGWVRNCPDGTVELEAEGPPDQVRGLLDALSAHFTGNITERDESNIPPLGRETGFVIR